MDNLKILEENNIPYTIKKGNYYFGNSRLLFIGVLFAGPNYNANGEIIVTTVPTQQSVHTQTPIMTNLGFYIKATELEEFRKIIQLNFA